MRILHIINGLGKGGAEAVLVKLVLHDTQNQHYVVSLTGPGYYSKVLAEENIDIYHINFRDKKLIFTNFFKLFKIIKNVDPSILQTWLYFSDLIGATFGKILRIERVFWNIRHSELDLRDTKFTTFLIAKICSIFSRTLPNGIIFCANKSYEYHKKFGYSNKRSIVIHNGYDFDALETFDPVAFAANLSFKHQANDFKIGMVARFAPEKDHANLFKALAILRSKSLKFHCYLAGTNVVETNELLLDLINEYGLRTYITLLGEIDYVPQFMRFIDVHVLSSSSEGFPNVVAEAMYSKTPCISTNVGDVTAIIKNFGWIVPIKSPLMLADAISCAQHEFVTDRNRWLKRTQSCNQHIRDSFAIQSMVQSYIKFWNE